MKFAQFNRTVCIIFLLLAAISYFSGIWDPDFFWHLATGRWIVEHGALPASDPFGVYTDSGSDRALLLLKAYWLCQTVYYFIYSLCGYSGFALLKSLVFTLFFTGIFCFFNRKRVPAGLSMASGLLLYLFLLDFRADRPQIFAYLATALLIILLESGKQRWIPLVMILWANMHGSFLLGAVLITIYMATLCLSSIRSGNWRLPPFIWGGAGLVSAFINPNGAAALMEVVAMQGGEYQKAVLEYASPLTLALKYHDIYWIYFLILAAGVILLLFLRSRVPPEQSASFAVLSLLSLTAGRYMAFAVIAGAIYLPLWLSPFLKREQVSKCIAAVSLAFLFYICCIDIKEGRGFTHGVEKGRFPEKGLQFIEKSRLEGSIFSSDYWGGYILWQSRGRRVSTDTRALSTSEYMRNLLLLTDHGSRDDLSSSSYSIVMTSAFNQTTGEIYRLWQNLAASGSWKLVYSDDITLVFARHNSTAAELQEPGARVLEHALSQAESFTKSFPDTPFHWINLADIHLLRRDPAKAIAALREALAKAPEDAGISNRLRLLEMGIY